jgi:hypothetical protein
MDGSSPSMTERQARVGNALFTLRLRPDSDHLGRARL